MSGIARSSEEGFTLIESMVALVILGIAAVGIIRAVESHIDRLRQLDQRASAQMVAENALAEARLGIGQSGDVTTRMLQRTWVVNTEIAPSIDRDMSLATVRVRPADSEATMIALRGFVDRGTTTP